jgi:hypothetical protein
MLRWSAQELANRASVSVQAIKRFATGDAIPPSRSSTLLDVKAALEAAGIEFIGSYRFPGASGYWLVETRIPAGGILAMSPLVAYRSHRLTYVSSAVAAITALRFCS